MEESESDKDEKSRYQERREIATDAMKDFAIKRIK